MPAVGAPEAPHGKFEVAPLNPYRLAIEQSVGHLLPS
jgi:hypothetical protein